MTPRIVWFALILVCAGIAVAAGPAVPAEPAAAVTVSGKAVLTMCRDWIVHRTCKPYDKIELPPRVAVGDKVQLSAFGSNPKDYVFHIVEIRRKGNGCVLLSPASEGQEDGERIEIARCVPVAEPAAEPR
ncbi:MAG: hypothetical protein AB7H90_03865 [Alphaproteobacteria bacterium]